MNDSNVALGSGLPGSASENMKSHLQPATAESKTVVSQVPPAITMDADALTLTGSHQGDHRSQAADVQANVERAAGVSKGPRDSTGMKGC
jgi:hypothetical protein